LSFFLSGFCLFFFFFFFFIFKKNVDNGQPEAVDGTSCSAPVFAGMVARLNEIRLSAGKPVLGYLNSLLFKLGQESPHVFTDITKGNNRGTEGGFGPGAICEYGFSATVGYDPVSGLGSPVFSELAKAVAALP
jgi:tripeptidyl-peptidase-1